MRQLLLYAFSLCTMPLWAQIISSDTLLPITNTPVQVGYGQQDVRTVNSAVTHLDARRFNQGQINDWNQLWQAQIPGFTITRSGSDPNEAMTGRIRGLHSILNSSNPLYVVDGVPGVDLFAVDPTDIVAIDVLRDIAATAIYGGRGANGVVLITTKPASGAFKIQYQGQLSYEQIAKRYDVLDEPGFLAVGGSDYFPNSFKNTDWQDLVLQSGVGHAHHLSLSSGLGRGFIRAGLHYRDVSGIVRASGFEQYNGSLLASQRFWHDRLTLTAGATAGQRNSDYGFPEAFGQAVAANPSDVARSDDPQFDPYDGYVNRSLILYRNPVALIDKGKNTGRTDFTLFHARAELVVLRNLIAGIQISEQTSNVHDRRFNSLASSPGFSRGVAVSEKSVQKTLESTLTYRLRAGDWQGELLGGYGWYQTQAIRSSAAALNVPEGTWEGTTWDQYYALLANSSHKDTLYSSFAENGLRPSRQLIAFFGRAQLQWHDTYFGTFSWRREGSSNLPPATRWGIFPAFSLGVDVNKWLNIQPVDYFKISFSHGVAGTEITQEALYQQVFRQQGKIYYNGQYIDGHGVTQYPNDRLGWERTSENSVGLQFSLYHSRLQGSIDWYRYRSRDLIQNVYHSPVPNYKYSTFENVAELAGHGTELNLNYQLAKNQDVTWEMGLSATTAGNTIEKTVDGNKKIPDVFIGCGCSGYYQLIYPGATIGTFWGPVVNGIDAAGNQTYEDLNGDEISGFTQAEVYDQDQMKLGDAQPDWMIGVSQKLTWKHIDLNFLLQSVTGHQIANEYRVAYEANSFFTGSNQVITRYYNPALKISRFNNRSVEDGSFLRMQYITLGYQLKLTKHKWISGLHFQLGAQNLFTLTAYTGQGPDLRLQDFGSNPDTSYKRQNYKGDPLAPGLDRRGLYPTARRWWLGVAASF